MTNRRKANGGRRGVGQAHAPLLEVAVKSLAELNDLITRSRFIEGRMSEGDSDGVCAGVLIATHRIQFVTEA